MTKVRKIQFRAQAVVVLLQAVVVLANIRYSHSVIANKLHPAKSCVSNWINRSNVDDLLVDKPRSGRPKVLSRVA